MSHPNYPGIQCIQAVRRFHRFYTQQIGLLSEGVLNSQFSLTEIRILFELYYRDRSTATQLSHDLSLDAGYLSRILRKLQQGGHVQRTQAPEDGRQSFLSLTKKGKEVFSSLDAQQNKEVGIFLSKLSPIKQISLVKAMHIIENLLRTNIESNVPYLLRSHRPGDLGWIVHRHGVIYKEEFGYNEHFEAMVANIAAEFLQNFDPTCEHCWIAERDCEIIGSIALMKKSRAPKLQGLLRLFLVVASARGLGVGKRLLQECLYFAKHAGYKKLSLLTHSELLAARHLYEQAGFKIVKQKPYQGWGLDNLVEESWELTL